MKGWYIMDNPFALIAKRKSLAGAYNSVRKQIENGIAKKTASTGTSINRLKGCAKTTAILSNIGGGSKATGGSGMKGGMKKIINANQCEKLLNALILSMVQVPDTEAKVYL